MSRTTTVVTMQTPDADGIGLLVFQHEAGLTEQDVLARARAAVEEAISDPNFQRFSGDPEDPVTWESLNLDIPESLLAKHGLVLLNVNAINVDGSECLP